MSIAPSEAPGRVMRRVGSLFAGYGGLDLAVEQVLDADLAWVSEIEDAPARILAHHWPDVPNLGDITAVDWAGVEPVDILTGGFPCQDVSAAGKRAGLRADTRTGLWSRMAEAIDALRPSLVVAENVRGLLSAHADSAMESCPWCVGDGPASGLRALGAVLGDLADIGYDARWCGLRAADVGAPHGRFRVFVVAWPAELAAGTGLQGSPSGRVQHELPGAGRGGSATDATSDGRHQGWPEPARIERGHDAAERGAPVADADRGGRQRRRTGQLGGASIDTAGDSAAAADAGRDTIRQQSVTLARGGGETEPRQTVQWGPYGPAIRRWERTLGRVAPSPTEPGRNGNPRLSPRFVEWMQGLADGWVTGVPGISRNDQLKALGNGVVPQQASEAIRRLLPALALELTGRNDRS